MIVVVAVKWWSLSTVGVNVGPVGLGMRAHGGVGVMVSVDFVGWW